MQKLSSNFQKICTIWNVINEFQVRKISIFYHAGIGRYFSGGSMKFRFQRSWQKNQCEKLFKPSKLINTYFQMGRGFGNQEISIGKIKQMGWVLSISFLKFVKQFESTSISVFKASPRRQGGGGSPCLRSLLSPPRHRLGDKAVVDRLASPYRFKNIDQYWTNWPRFITENCHYAKTRKNY